MKRKVTITSQSDLEEQWVDPACPNMTFGYREEDLEECLQPDGTYQASYHTLEVPTGESMSFTYLTSSGESTYTLTSGEYGIKPN